MLRSAVLVGLLLASCKGSGSKPAAAGSGSASGSAAVPASASASVSGSASASGSASGSGAGSGSDAAAGSGSAAPAATGPGIAKPLRGPFATIDAYCETRPKGDDRECANADMKTTGSLPAGLLEAAAIYDNNDGPNHDIGCAIALRTSTGWFVGPPSAETCREPSYIELQGIDIDTDASIAAITLGINWHTNNGDEDANYKLAALCGVSGGAPACTPVFLSQCDANAPASGCGKTPFELTWTLDGDTATFTPDRKIDNDAVPTGKQTILGGR